MRPRYLAPVAIVVVLLLARVWMATAGTTPAGQPPLADVPTLDALRAEFNRDAAKMRVILSLAPTCPYCLKGGTGIERLLARHPDYPLVVYNVWQPVLPTDWGKPGTGALARLPTRACGSSGTAIASWRAPSSTRRKAGPSSRTAASSVASGGTSSPSIRRARQWTDKLPEPVLLDGTVDDAIPAFEALLTKATESSREVAARIRRPCSQRAAHSTVAPAGS